MKFGEAVKQANGKRIPFNQLNYMKDPNVGAMYHKIEIDDGKARLDSIGQCTGLSTAFLIAKKMSITLGGLSTKDLLDVFLDFIKQKDGAALVASIQLDVEIAFNKAGKQYGGIAAEQAVANFLAQGYENTCLKHKNTSPTCLASQSSVCDYILAETGYYTIGFEQHACAAWNGTFTNGDRGITFFDPNRGFVNFSKGNYATNFKKFIGLYFTTTAGNSHVGRPSVLSRYS